MDDFGLDLSDTPIKANPMIAVVLLNREHAEIFRRQMNIAIFEAMPSSMPILWKGRTFLFAYGTSGIRAYVETPIFRMLD